MGDDEMGRWYVVRVICDEGRIERGGLEIGVGGSKEFVEIGVGLG